MHLVTWRRAAGTLLVAAPSFLLVVWSADFAVSVLRFRQDYAAQSGALFLLTVICSAWVYGEDIYAFAAKIASPFALSRRGVRLSLALLAGWCAAVLLFVWAFEPFGRYMGDREWLAVGKIITFPLALGAIVVGLYRWAKRP